MADGTSSNQQRTNKEPALLPGWRSASKMRSGHRSLTMLRAVCRICEAEGFHPREYAKTCPHDPYITMVPKFRTEVEWDDLVDERGNKTGERVRRPNTERTVEAYEPRPNVVNVAISPRVNGGFGLSNARWKGFIMPSELRSPHFPNGIADTCEFHNCRQQKGLTDYTTGRFCRREEAAICYFEATGNSLEVGTGAVKSDQRRREQLAGAPV